MIFNHVEEVIAGLAPGNAVGFVGINHQLELFAGINQRIHHLNAVLKMYVVVAGSVRDEQRTVQIRGCLL